MRFAVGADDEAEIVEAVVNELRRRGHEVCVFERDQWPEIANLVAKAVASGEADQGVLFCWTGTGTAMAANRAPGIRAALAWEPWIARGARLWNDANVLVMSLKRTAPAVGLDILDAWLAVNGPDPSELVNIRRLS